jgi:hypothetical protein
MYLSSPLDSSAFNMKNLEESLNLSFKNLGMAPIHLEPIQEHFEPVQEKEKYQATASHYTVGEKENKAIVHDHLVGQHKIEVLYEKKNSQKNGYLVLSFKIDGLVLASDIFASKTFRLGNTQELSFTKHRHYVEITEKDNQGENHYFADISHKVVCKTANKTANCFAVYTYKQVEMSVSEVQSKVKDFRTAHPDLEVKFVYHNEHGIVLLAYEMNKSDMQVFAMKPDQMSLVQVENPKITLFRDGGSFFIESTKDNLCLIRNFLERTPSGPVFSQQLNHTPVTDLNLNF